VAGQFNADEIFEMGEEVERNGAAFYRAAEKRFEDAALREVLRDLGDQEADHIRIFRRLRKELVAKTGVTDDFDPQGEAAAYLRAAAGNHVFLTSKSIDEILADVKTPRDVLLLAIRFERDTIVFFEAMRDLVPADLGRDAVLRLIEEEHEHVKTLEERLATQGDG